MGVTVNANGLSIVHKGSGGEANATLPDVCLTQCGPPVVPIPYGNNAKSADLVDGTTTITMDGGNSVAIKGSKFSKSTGDSGGDKKGVASGTIEGEAEFISASPTVKFEGAGVCRLSDQMTMNKANTMCLGGAQNPSVSVSEDAEGTYTIDVQCCYPDGEPLTNAKFKVLNSAGAEIASGQLDNKGKGSVGGLPAGMCVIEYEEDARPFSVIPMRNTNPHKKELSDDEFFEYCAKDCLPFWKSRTIDASRQSWGVFESNLSTDTQFKQMLAYEFHTHFQYQASDYEVHLLATSLTTLFDDNNADNGHIENYISVLASIVAPDGEVITLTQKIHKDESKHNFLALMRARGYGDAQTYLQDFDWDAQKKLLVNETSDVLQKVQTRLETMKQYADREGYEAISVQLGEHAEKVKNTKQGLSDSFSQAIASLKEKSQTIQQNGSTPKVVNQFQNGGSSESGKVNDKVYVQKVMPKPLSICLTYDDREKTPVSNVPYQAKYSNGEVFKGWLDGEGKALIYGVPQEVPELDLGDEDEAKSADSALDEAYENLNSQLDSVVQDKLVQMSQLKSDPVLSEYVKNYQEQFDEIKLAAEAEIAELKAQKEDFNHMSYLEQAWGYASSGLVGLGSGVINYVPDLGEFGELMDMADISITMLVEAIATGDTEILQRKLAQIDRAAIGLQEASESMEILLLLLSDPTTRDYLASLPKRFLEAAPPDDIAYHIISQGTQKLMDIGVTYGGTTAATAGSVIVGGFVGGPPGAVAAGGAVGPTAGAALTGLVVARNGGKVIEALVDALHAIAKHKKAIHNKHKSKPHQEDNETELPKQCPICGKKSCKNRKRIKVGKGNNGRGNYLGEMESAYKKKGKLFPSEHDWYTDGNSLEVHHSIPVEAVNTPLFKKLFDKFSYDINGIHNLVTLPSDMQLACELGVQRHNGPHSQGLALTLKAGVLLSKLEDYEDAGNAKAIRNFNKKVTKSIGGDDFRYPKAAQAQALEVKDKIEKGQLCKYASDPKKLNAMFVREMKKQSTQILRYIESFNWTIAYDGRDYRADGPGCCNVKTIKQKRKGLQRGEMCRMKRNHNLGKGKFEGMLRLGS